MKFFPAIVLAALIGGGAILGAAGCGTPAASIGYTIPGTPISLGMSVPLDRQGNVILGRDPRKTAWRQVDVASDPPGAEIYIDNDLVGATPSTVSVPFDKGAFGSAKGTSMILLKKPGYLPEGFRVFPASGGVTIAPEGQRVATIQKALRRSN